MHFMKYIHTHTHSHIHTHLTHTHVGYSFKRHIMIYIGSIAIGVEHCS